MSDGKTFTRQSGTVVSKDKKVDGVRDEKGKFVPGHPGSKKGTTHRFTDLKKVFLAVFEKIETEAELKESVDSFYDWAIKNTKNQGEFYKLVAKMLPRNLDVTLPTDTVIKVISAVPRPAETAPKPEEKK